MKHGCLVPSDKHCGKRDKNGKTTWFYVDKTAARLKDMQRKHWNLVTVIVESYTIQIQTSSLDRRSSVVKAEIRGGVQLSAIHFLTVSLPNM